MSLKVHIYPDFRGPDKGDGGVRRVVEGQVASLAHEGIEVVALADDADVIASHITIPHAYVNRFPSKPFVAHCHGLYWDEYKFDDGASMWESWALKANEDVMEAIRIADITTAPAEWVSQSIRRATCRDVRTVPHGIDSSKWTHRAEHGRFVLWNKNRADPVCDPRPVGELAELLPDFYFRSTFGNPAPNVEILGRQGFEAAQANVEQAMAYLATTRETFGVGTLEALAAGVPVVGWAWGSTPDIVEHGIDGWLARPGDIEGLAEGLKWAATNREQLAGRCRAKAEQFPWSRAAALYADIYREAFERRNQDRPKVSVVMPAYNMRPYLPDAINSVLTQTLTDCELIIVNDASTDGTKEWLDVFEEGIEGEARDRLRIIHNETNLHVSATRNVGIANARGEYVIQLDADDQLPANALEILSGALDADRRIHAAYGGVLFVNEDGRTPTVYRDGDGAGHSGWPPDFRFDWQLSPPLEQAGNRPPNLVPYAAMVRREALEAVGRYRTRLKTAEDPDMWCRLASYGFRIRKVTNADALIYRNRAGSLSQTIEPLDWSAWFPWARNPELAPAGADTPVQLGVLSLDPPLVSVVIPVGPGHGHLIQEAVDSVDAQTFRQFECIVVNDSGAPLPPLPSWVRVVEIEQWTASGNPADFAEAKMITFPDDFKQKRFGGVAQARNAGIAVARARDYFPLDADDWLQPEALAMLMDVRAETGDILYPDWWEDPDQPGRYQVWETKEWIPATLITDGAIHAVSALTPVAAWRKVGGYDENVHGWEDWAFQIACAEACICSRRVPAPLFTYRKHTGQRRDENFANPASEADIREKYAEYWNGGKQMPNCATCGGRRVAAPPPQQFGEMEQQSMSAPGMTLVRYIGARTGMMPYRGRVTRATYNFARGVEVYVANDDLQPFRERTNEFMLVTEGTPAAIMDAPALAEPTYTPPPPPPIPTPAYEPTPPPDPAMRYEPPAGTALAPPTVAVATPEPDGVPVPRQEPPTDDSAPPIGSLEGAVPVAGADAIQKAAADLLQEENAPERPGKRATTRPKVRRG